METIMTSMQNPVASESEPWLVFCHGKISHIFYNIFEDCYQVKNIPDMLQKEFCICLHGWMLILDSEQGQCFLLNPFSLDKIHLPPHNWESVKYTEYLLSSPPYDPNCSVLFTNADGVLFCRLRDNKWINLAIGEFRCPVSCNGAVYALIDDFRGLGRIKTESDPIELEILPTRKPHVQSDLIGAHLVGFADFMLVGSGNELFLYFVHDLTRVRETMHHNKRRKSNMVCSFQIFKMDFSTMEWKRVRDLENKALLLDSVGNGTLYLPTARSRILPNTIYFTKLKDSCLYRFDMKEKSISVTLPCPDLVDDLADSLWVIPDVKSIEISQMMKMKMKIQQGQQSKASHRKEILEESKKEDLCISFKVRTKSALTLTIGALLPLILLGLVMIAMACVSAAL